MAVTRSAISAATDFTPSATATSQSITLSTNSAGDRLLIFAASSGQASAMGAPSGWSLIGSIVSDGGTGGTSEIYSKISNGSEGASITHSWSGARGAGFRCATYTGGDVFDSEVRQVKALVGTNTLTLPSIDADRAGMLIGMMSASITRAYSSIITTEIFDTSNATAALSLAGYEMSVAAGATGDKTITSSGGTTTRTSALMMVLLEPASGGTTIQSSITEYGSGRTYIVLNSGITSAMRDAGQALSPAKASSSIASTVLEAGFGRTANSSSLLKSLSTQSQLLRSGDPNKINPAIASMIRSSGYALDLSPAAAAKTSSVKSGSAGKSNSAAAVQADSAILSKASGKISGSSAATVSSVIRSQGAASAQSPVVIQISSTVVDVGVGRNFLLTTLNKDLSIISKSVGYDPNQISKLIASAIYSYGDSSTQVSVSRNITAWLNEGVLLRPDYLASSANTIAAVIDAGGSRRSAVGSVLSQAATIRAAGSGRTVGLLGEDRYAQFTEAVYTINREYGYPIFVLPIGVMSKAGGRTYSAAVEQLRLSVADKGIAVTQSAATRLSVNAAASDRGIGYTRGSGIIGKSLWLTSQGRGAGYPNAQSLIQLSVIDQGKTVEAVIIQFGYQLQVVSASRGRSGELFLDVDSSLNLRTHSFGIGRTVVGSTALIDASINEIGVGKEFGRTSLIIESSALDNGQGWQFPYLGMLALLDVTTIGYSLDSTILITGNELGVRTLSHGIGRTFGNAVLTGAFFKPPIGIVTWEQGVSGIATHAVFIQGTVTYDQI